MADIPEIEITGYCWNCGHNMIHTRTAISFFPRVTEAFSKRPDGKVNQRIWMVMFDSYQFCHCKSCRAPSLFVDSYWTKTTDEGEAQHIQDAVRATGSCPGYSTERAHFPAFNKTAFPAWTHDLEEVDMRLFWEVYTAMAQGLCSIAMMGIRAIVDRYANKTVGDKGGFDKKLSLLKEQGYISCGQADQLRVVVEAGHAAAHRGITYKREHVRAALDVVESMLARERFGDAIESLRQVTPLRVKS